MSLIRALSCSCRGWYVGTRNVTGIVVVVNAREINLCTRLVLWSRNFQVDCRSRSVRVKSVQNYLTRKGLSFLPFFTPLSPPGFVGR